MWQTGIVLRRFIALAMLAAVSALFVINRAFAQSIPAPSGDGPSWGWVAAFALLVLMLVFAFAVGFVLRSYERRIDHLEKAAEKLNDRFSEHLAKVEGELLRALAPMNESLAKFGAKLEIVMSKGKWQ
jgi:membrane protein implicated in regulation of membrane protease activity